MHGVLFGKQGLIFSKYFLNILTTADRYMAEKKYRLTFIEQISYGTASCIIYLVIFHMQVTAGYITVNKYSSTFI